MKLTNEFLDGLLAEASHTRESFRPTVRYDSDGDCIEFFISREDYLPRRLDGLVTIYYGRETGDIVGSVIKGVRAFCEGLVPTMPGFCVKIKEGGQVKIQHVFLARMWSTNREGMTELIYSEYEKLAEIANTEELQTKFCTA